MARPNSRTLNTRTSGLPKWVTTVGSPGRVQRRASGTTGVRPLTGRAGYRPDGRRARVHIRRDRRGGEERSLVMDIVRMELSSSIAGASRL